jgi:hypothetical protein
VEDFVAVPTLHIQLMITMLLPHMNIQITLPPQQSTTNLTLILGRCLRMLLHYMHFQTAMLREPGLTLRTLIRLLPSVAELVPLQMKTISKTLPTNFTFKRSFPGVTSEMPPQFTDFNTRVVAQSAFERFLPGVLIPPVSR